MENQPTPDQQPGTPGNAAIPREHIPLTLNSLIHERILGFARRLNGEGNWEWQGEQKNPETGAKSLTGWTTEPPFNFTDDANLAASLVQRVCLEKGLFCDVQFSGERGLWTVKYGQRIEDSEDCQLVGQPASGKPLSLVLVLCTLSVIEAPIQAQHRILFPGHYIARPS